jgi:hypothetical protein
MGDSRMKKIITLAQSLMQEIERYDKELIEIEKVSDYRWEENEKLKKENKLLQQQIEKMKCCFNCAHFSGGFMCVFRCEKDDEIRKSVVTKKDVKKAICNNWRLAE